MSYMWAAGQRGDIHVNDFTKYEFDFFLLFIFQIPMFFVMASGRKYSKCRFQYSVFIYSDTWSHSKATVFATGFWGVLKAPIIVMGLVRRNTRNKSKIQCEHLLSLGFLHRQEQKLSIREHTGDGEKCSYVGEPTLLTSLVYNPAMNECLLVA